MSCMLLGATCGFSQKLAYNQPDTKRMRGVDADLHMHYGAQGVLHVQGNESCDIWLDVNEAGRMYRYIPMNLPEELKVDGSELSFDYGIPEKTAERSCLGRGIYVANARITNPRDSRK